jgi:Tfp pilus assembly protein PilF
LVYPTHNKYKPLPAVFACLLSLAAAFLFAQPALCAPVAAAGDEAILAEANRQASHFAYPEAEKLYQKFLAAHWQNQNAHHMYGRMLALEARWEDALHEYRTSLKLKPNDPSVLNDIGVALSINNYQALGARFLNQAAQVDRLYPGALNNLGVVLNSLDAFKQACDSFLRSLEIQPRNLKIKELLDKTLPKIAESKAFDFGPPVSFQDVPEVLKKMKPPAEAPVLTNNNDKQPKVATAVETPAKVMNEADKTFLAKTQPLFLELKATGFTTLSLAGNGMVQVNDKSDSAENIGEVDLSKNPRVEIMGDVTIDLTGPGELQLGKAHVTARGEDCIFSISAESSDLSCYAGDFKVANWAAVTATRTAAKVAVEVENCQSVYGQDDSRVEANNCDEVTLVGHSQGIVSKCKKVIVNDNASAVARNCNELTALANARVRASGCSKLEKLDHAKIEDAND